MLAVFAAVVAAPPQVAAHAQACSSQGAAAPAPAVVATADDAACPHPVAGLCLNMMSCPVPPAAVRATATWLPSVRTTIVWAVAALTGSGQYAAGPPTPPPNTV
jgi:hypothetical protein